MSIIRKSMPIDVGKRYKQNPEIKAWQEAHPFHVVVVALDGNRVYYSFGDTEVCSHVDSCSARTFHQIFLQDQVD